MPSDAVSPPAETGWNLYDLSEINARLFPEEPALRHGERTISWADFSRRTRSFGAALLEAGLGRQAKVAQYLFNAPEYMESFYGAFAAAMVPVNTNYRYVDDELVYLWDNSDSEAVVFHGCFAETIERVRERVPRVRIWIHVDDGSGAAPDWAVGYEELVAAQSDLALPWRRSGDDLFLLYTGGTTGMPKGVMWRQDDVYRLSNARRPEPFDLDGGLEGYERQRRLDPLVGRVTLPACPLMHGTGMITAIGAISAAGCVVTLENRRFDVEALLNAVERFGVQGMAIVGDAFARPMVEALDAQPGRWNLSSLDSVVSSGVMWSQEVKQAMLRHHPAMILRDSLGSSESIGMGVSESGGVPEGGAEAVATAKFQLGEETRVLREDGTPVSPGSGELGRIAVAGPIPVGYYNDPVKTAETFVTVNGVRYSMAGDWATVEADGSITLLGRGSVCINTGGEKVFPEEVEEVLKQHGAVRDAVCVGVPDPRFGQKIVAVVEVEATRDESPLEGVLIEHVRQRLAAYKAPRVVLERAIGRAANGKADYPGIRKWAEDRVVS